MPALPHWQHVPVGFCHSNRPHYGWQVAYGLAGPNLSTNSHHFSQFSLTLVFFMFSLGSSGPHTTLQTNPHLSKQDGAKSALTRITIALGITTGVIVLLMTVWGILLQRSGAEPSRLMLADLFFPRKHVTPDGGVVRVFRTDLGGIFTIMAIALMSLLAILLIYQNTYVYDLSSAISTSSLPFEPTGLFQLTATVHGNGLGWADACVNGSIFTLSPTIVADWVGDTAPVPNTFSAVDNSCTLTWRCPFCRMASSFSKPTFALATRFHAWAHYVTYTVSTPALMEESAAADNGPAFSVTQTLYPSSLKPLNSNLAFRTNYVQTATKDLMGGNAGLYGPTVSVMLTGFVVDNTVTGTVRATFQPSVANADASVPTTPPSTPQIPLWNFLNNAPNSLYPAGVVAAAQQPAVFTPAYINPTSGIAPANLGFQITFVLTRNSVNMITYVDFSYMFDFDGLTLYKFYV
jgi:hypothetical protein